MLITDTYKTLQAQLHATREDYGAGGHKWADRVLDIAKRLGTRDILDYGCGKRTLAKSLPFPIANYDPAIPEFASPPPPTDLVVCTDVAEHIEPDCLDNVLDDLVRVTRRLLILEVATRPAVKFLADGRNAHLIQETIGWWLPKLCSRFEILKVDNLQNESFVVIAAPLAEPLT